MARGFFGLRTLTPKGSVYKCIKHQTVARSPSLDPPGPGIPRNWPWRQSRAGSGPARQDRSGPGTQPADAAAGEAGRAGGRSDEVKRLRAARQRRSSDQGRRPSLVTSARASPPPHLGAETKRLGHEVGGEQGCARLFLFRKAEDRGGRWWWWGLTLKHRETRLMNQDSRLVSPRSEATISRVQPPPPRRCSSRTALVKLSTSERRNEREKVGGRGGGSEEGCG